MLTKFRTHYPHGSLLSELITIDRGQYIVKVTIRVDGIILSTGLAAADRIETAEDNARERALLTLALDSHPEINTPSSSLEDSGLTVNNQTEMLTTSPSPSTPPVKQDSHVANLSVPPESKTSSPLPPQEKETDQIESMPVNSPTSAAAIKPEVTNDRVESSTTAPSIAHYGHLEVSQTTDSAYPPLTTKINEPDAESIQHQDNSFASSPREDLSSETSQATLDLAQPEVTSTQTIATVEFDFNEIKNRTDVEIKRLGWTKEQGRDFLLQTYGKRSRLHLTDQELMDFLHYLESQPNP